MQYDFSFDTKDLTFLTTCNGAYHNFVAPFIHFCKVSNPGCKIEIWAEKPDTLKFLNVPNVKIHQLPLEYHVATYRYIAEPTHRTKHTYITDIDIMHTELVQPFHLQHMKETGLCFSNIQRIKKGEVGRLSGLHFVETDTWYDLTSRIRSEIEPKGEDERMLFDIAGSICQIEKVSKGLSKRPIHGIHCSAGRNARAPYSSKGWEITSQKLDILREEILKVGMFNEWFETNVCSKLYDKKIISKINKRFPYGK